MFAEAMNFCLAVAVGMISVAIPYSAFRFFFPKKAAPQAACASSQEDDYPDPYSYSSRMILSQALCLCNTMELHAKCFDDKTGARRAANELAELLNRDAKRYFETDKKERVA